MKVNPEEHIGKKYGCLTILKYYKTGNNGVEFYVKCDCGNIFTNRFSRIKECKKYCRKCISQHKTQIYYKQLYKIWIDIRYRCSPNCKHDRSYKNYYLRGIRVCDEWQNNYKTFEKWSLENGYKEEKLPNGKNKWTIDRINNDGNYEPSNCRWVDIYTQANNTRNNKYITYKGETKTLAQWCRELNLNYNRTINRLLYTNCSIEEAFEKPKTTIITYKYKDKELTANEICNLTGLTLSGFYSRLNRNWTIERILETKSNEYFKNKK